MTQYQDFLDLTDELYPDCTTEQKLGVYIQHHPARVIAFLLELILELHPEPVEETDERSTGSD